MPEAVGAGFEPTLVTSRWSLGQFALLACYTTGLHGVTSFPYYIHKHSGLFLVAFYVIIVLICLPICYVQIKIGTLFKRGIVGIFAIVLPIIKGAAVSILVLTYIRCLLHALELSYALHFALSSLKRSFWLSDLHPNVSSGQLPSHLHERVKYFHEDFLDSTENIGEGGCVVWYIALSLLATWLVTFLLTCRGTSLLAKIAYILTPTTLLALVIVMMYSYVTIPDACQAVKKLLGSKGETDIQTTSADVKGRSFLDNVVNYKLGHPGPWIDALNLHIHSLGLWSGVLPTLGTLVLNRKYTINAWIILLLVYSLLPQLALFALAPYIDPSDTGGFISTARGIKPGLPFIFIAIPVTFERMDLSPFIGFCLFISIFLLGLHHQALHLLAIWDNLLPSTPKFIMSYFGRREILVLAVCGVSFMLCIPFSIQGGIHLYAIINSYVNRLDFVLIIISTVPFLMAYVKQELYIPIERAFMSIWYGLAACVSSALMIYYFTVYVYPHPVVAPDQSWAEAVGWLVAVMPVVLGLVLGAAHAIWSQKGSWKQRFVESLKSESFNPSEESNEYTTADTADTATAVPLAPPCEEKTETEVFVQPVEDEEDPVHV